MTISIRKNSFSAVIGSWKQKKLIPVTSRMPPAHQTA